MTPNGDFQATLTEQRMFAVMPLTGPPGPPMGVQDEGSPLPAFNIINFVGDGVTAAGDAPGNRITITIPGAVAGLVDSVFTRTGDVIAQSGDYTAAQVTNAVSTLGSYADPAWITALSWDKITGEPSTFPPDAHVHAAADTTSGVFATARLGSGAASASVWLRGDSQWSTVPAADWSDIPGKPTTFPPDAHVHAAADTTSGVFATVRLGAGTASASTYLRGDSVWAAAPAADWSDIPGKPTTFPPDAHVHAAADVTSGVFAVARLATGTPSIATFVRGDGTWAALSSAQTPWTQNIDGGGFNLSNTGDIGVGPTARMAVLSAPVDGATDSGALVFSTRYLGTLGERVRITAAGNVGIATTPAYPLQFSNDLVDKVMFFKLGSIECGIGLRSDDFQIFTRGAEAIVVSLNANGTQCLAARDGKVGIGTAAPWGKLTVSGVAAEASLVHNTVATAAFTTPGFTELAIFNSTVTGFPVVLQTRHNSADGFSFPIALNPLGGNVTIGGTGSAIQVYLGGSLKTLSVDGSGFVKAA